MQWTTPSGKHPDRTRTWTQPAPDPPPPGGPLRPQNHGKAGAGAPEKPRKWGTIRQITQRFPQTITRKAGKKPTDENKQADTWQTPATRGSACSQGPLSPGRQSRCRTRHLGICWKCSGRTTWTRAGRAGSSDTETVAQPPSRQLLTSLRTSDMLGSMPLCCGD